MKAVLLDVKNEEVKVVDIEDKLEEYYKLLDCETIDIVERKLAGKPFDIICDDEGLLTENPKISAINNMGEPMLVGNLLFMHHNDEGEMTGLSDYDIQYIKFLILKMGTRQFPKGYPMLTQCEY